MGFTPLCTFCVIAVMCDRGGVTKKSSSQRVPLSSASGQCLGDFRALFGVSYVVYYFLAFADVGVSVK